LQNEVELIHAQVPVPINIGLPEVSSELFARLFLAENVIEHDRRHQGLEFVELDSPGSVAIDGFNQALSLLEVDIVS
jgi:hypothetical protein